MERVQKVIANNGYCSRRKAEELIKAVNYTLVCICAIIGIIQLIQFFIKKK